MRAIGTARYAGELYYVFINDTKSKEIWYLVSPYHKEDIVPRLLGQALTYPILGAVSDLELYDISEDYIIEAVSRTKVSGKVEVYGNYNILDRMQGNYSIVRSYGFKKERILTDKSYLSGSDYVHDFEANDGGVEYRYLTKNKLLSRLRLVYKDLVIDVVETTKARLKSDIKFSEVTNIIRKKVLLSSVKSITYKDLQELLDLEWYEKDGVLQKDYRSIKNVKEFEEVVMQGIAEELEICKSKGEKLILAVDTETTGLNICNLSKFNDVKDHLVAIPIAWKDNSAVTIFCDMEFFDNISVEYVINRLKCLMEEHDNDIIFDGGVEKLNELTTMSAFGSSTESDTSIPTSSNGKIEDSLLYVNSGSKAESGKVYRRTDINLIGHNVLFDGKVFLDEGLHSYWDNDTMVMSFNINPKVARGSNKLKRLTRVFFNHETPELDDLLGKGNEDKYKYISDERVAIIYGCADADYTRLVFKKLRALTPDHMYLQYQKQDIPILNILYESEYNGLNTDSESVIADTDKIAQNLEILKGFMYNYVGIHIDFKNQYVGNKMKFEAGILTKEEFDNSVSNIKCDPNAEYPFEVKGSNIRNIMYEILEYPIYGYTKNADESKRLPSVDKYIMNKLMRKKYDKPSGFLKKDILSSNGKSILISSSEFNKYKYPLAYILSIYGEINKEYTSYYKPIKETNIEGKIFRGYSLTRIETRRIMNPAQTIKSSLKKFIIGYTKDHYPFDFDMSQVEFRIMGWLAKFTAIVEKMRDPEKDYHIETASLMHSIPAHKVSKSLRKKTKNVSFGVPYGLSDYKLCENLFGEVNDDTMYETRKLLYIFGQNNKPIMDLINRYREESIKPVEVPPALRKFWDIDPDVPIGMIKNELGFYRYFDLSNLDRKHKGSIQRAAGNYPIQSFAAELFRIILIRFYKKCKEYGIQDKILWHMLIHDELFGSAHKSVHPFLLCKIIKEACMISLSGNSKYFVGINIGDTWEDCKDDSSELPVIFVNRIVERYDNGEFKEEWTEDPKNYVLSYKKLYITERIKEVFTEVQPNIMTDIIDVPLILERCTNYTVRSYIDGYKCNRCISNNNSRDKGICKKCFSKQGNEDLIYIMKMESWALEVFGEGKELKHPNGTTYKIMKQDIIEEVEEVDLELKLEVDIDEVADSYWSFDEQDLEEYYGGTIYVPEYDDSEEEFVVEGNYDTAKNVADLIMTKAKSYKNLKKLMDRVIVTVDREHKVDKVKHYLINHQDKAGTPITFRTPLKSIPWIAVAKDLDLDELDKFVSGVK